MAQQEEIPIAVEGHVGSMDDSDFEVEINESQAEDEEMFDAGDGSEEDETYFGGPNGHADSDDDDDFAEAHGAFATPAGSNMGDDDDHAIDDMHRAASEAIDAAADHLLRSEGQGSVSQPAVTPAAAQLDDAKDTPNYAMTPDMALSSLNFIMSRNANPDTAVLAGLTKDNVLDKLTSLISEKVQDAKPESIKAMADALRPALPSASAQEGVQRDEATGSTAAQHSSATAEGAPRVVEGNGSSGEKHVSHVERTERAVSPQKGSSSAAGGSSGSSGREEGVTVTNVNDSHVKPVDEGNAASIVAADNSEAAAGGTTAVETTVKAAQDSAVTGSSSSGLLRASSSINGSDSNDAAERVAEAQQEASSQASSNLDSAEAEAVLEEAKAEEEVEDITPSQQAQGHAVAWQPMQQASQAAPAPEEAVHRAGGNGSTAPLSPSPAPAQSRAGPPQQQKAGEKQEEPKQDAVKQEVKVEEQPPQPQQPPQQAPPQVRGPELLQQAPQQAQQQARGPVLPQRSGPSLPQRAAGSAAPSLPPRPSQPAVVVQEQESTAAVPALQEPAAAAAASAVASKPPAAATAAPGAASSGTSGLIGGGSGGPSLPTRPQRSGPVLPARTAGPTPSAPAPVPSGTARGQAPQPAAAAPTAATTAPASGQQIVPAPTAGAVAAPPAAAAEEESEENQELRRRVQALRVMLLRITRRLGVDTQSSVVQQVLMRLDMAERIKLTRRAPTRGPSPFAAAQAEAEELECGEGATAELPFCCTIMLLGLSGGGKSSTINSLLDSQACRVSPFEPATKKVEVIEGSAKGVKMRFIDTPGLQMGAASRKHNQDILAKVKKATKQMKPDIVLWVDRMDVLRRPGTDLGVLQQVSECLGNTVWFNTVLVMTHGAKVPPEGPGGPMAWSAYVNHRMSSLQQGVRAAAKDYRLMNPAALVENHSACRRDEAGEPILPNGTPWRQHLLMLGLSSKLLVDAEKALDVQKRANPTANAMAQMGRFRPQKLPPIPYLLSQLIQPKRPFKFPEEERTILSKSNIDDIADNEERKDEFRKRRLFLQQQDQMRREEEEGKLKGPVAIPAEELPLQPTFDPELGYNRYFHMPSGSGWIAQPHVEDNSVEHDDGVEGITIQLDGVVRPPKAHLGGCPGHFHAQMHADKTTTSVISELSASLHHTKKIVSTGGIDFQTVGGDHLWVVRGETRAKGLPGGSRIATGITASRMVDGGGLPTKGPVVYGVKMEDRMRVRRNMKAVASAGLMTARTRAGKEIGYAANAKLSSTHGLDDSTVVLVETSLMKFRNDLMIGGNASAQTNPTPQTQVSGRVNLNTKGTGGLTLRVTSHDKKELVYSFVAPALGFLIAKIRNRGNADDA